MDPRRSYAGIGALLQRYLNDSDGRAWEAIKARIDYTFEMADHALALLALVSTVCYGGYYLALTYLPLKNYRYSNTIMGLISAAILAPKRQRSNREAAERSVISSEPWMSCIWICPILS